MIKRLLFSALIFFWPVSAFTQSYPNNWPVVASSGATTCGSSGLGGVADGKPVKVLPDFDSVAKTEHIPREGLTTRF